MEKLSKYAAKRKKKLLDLREEQDREEEVVVSTAPMITGEVLREKKVIDLREPEPEPQPVFCLKETIRNRLFSKEGAGAYHRGNPFAVAFNNVLNNS